MYTRVCPICGRYDENKYEPDKTEIRICLKHYLKHIGFKEFTKKGWIKWQNQHQQEHTRNAFLKQQQVGEIIKTHQNLHHVGGEAQNETRIQLS
ncbi:hypothetical protein [Dipodfec virus UOA04_Rod_724]|nr:hypothetical protein [Dipodfec virus UOA04_Rod_724]